MVELIEKQRKRLDRFIKMDDLEFYEEHLADLPLEEQAAFMKEFPEFLDAEPIKKDELETDEIFQKIRNRIGNA